MAKIKPRHRQKKGGEIIIENPSSADAQELLLYLKQTHQETDFLLREPEELEDMTREQEEEFIENMNESDCNLFIVARKDDKIIGNLGFTGSTLKRYCHQGEFGMSVLKEYWGQGIGSLLLEALLEWTADRDITRISLRVDTDNTKAIGLYQKFGFTKEGILRRKKRLPDGEYRDEMVMARLFE